MDTDATRTTYCRICEALCGLQVTLERGRIVAISGDPEHPTSRGYMCPKGAAAGDVTGDPDRVLTPLRRAGGPGEFTPVSWDEALDDIAARVARLVDVHGPNAIALYSGNPNAFNIGGMVWWRSASEGGMTIG